MKKKKCILIYLKRSSFVESDLVILRKEYSVVEIEVPPSHGWRFAFAQLSVLFALLQQIWGSQFVFIWFADYHSVMPTLFCKALRIPSYLVIGGYDAMKIPEINYGAHLRPFRSWCVSVSCRMASKLLPVSQFARRNLEKNLNQDFGDKAVVVFNGVDTANVPLISQRARKPQVVTVCGGSSVDRLILKGVDFFVEVANANPDLSFLVIGVKGIAYDWVKAHAKENLEIMGWVTAPEVRRLLGEATVVCQFSKSESFGMALAEGMYCGCVPIGCSFTGTAEVLEGTTGLLVDDYEVSEGSIVVRAALKIASDEVSMELREAVKTRFSREIREKAVMKIVAKV